jgi:2-phospho-L-lactate/phosphoenolpyruvate guanylyltransferase
VSHADSARADGGVWAVVPYKGPVGSKRRLSPLLDEEQRGRLSQVLFEGVLDAVLGTQLVRRILVVQPPSVSIPGHDDPRLEFVHEPPANGRVAQAGSTDDLNRALAYAQKIATDRGVGSLLILPSDLPMVTTADVEALVEAASTEDIVIAPDQVAEGTNALLLRPPDALRLGFGAGSFGRHRQRAYAAGRRVSVERRWGLALDLDTPADVLRLYAVAPDCPAARLLQQMGVTAATVERLGLSETIPSGA